jgi:hypothetical protein
MSNDRCAERVMMRECGFFTCENKATLQAMLVVTP